jgi:hypothetical protein
MSSKPILDDLFSLLSPSMKAALAEEFKTNGKAKEMVEQGLTFRAAYLEGEEPPPVEVPPIVPVVKTPAEIEAERVERARVAAAAAGHGNGSADLRALTAELTSLKTTLDEKLKNVITTDKLPTLRGQLLESTILNSVLAMKITSLHEKDFGEELDMVKLNEHINEAAKSGRVFPNIKVAYDDWTNERRVQKRIADGVAEGIKQKKSADAVPGQSGPAAMSRAQAMIKKAAGESQGNVNDYADELRKIREAREGVGEGAAA